VITGWAGIRGALSLAAALAIPFTVRSGAPFPERDRIIFLTFGVILVTLVLQGLTMPALIRRLGVKDPEIIDDLRRHYTRRLRRLRARADGKPDGRHETAFLQSRRLQKELLDAERSTVIELRDQGVINDQVLHEIERDLDLEWVGSGRDLERTVEERKECGPVHTLRRHQTQL
jgi:NhaP-type Na+/H+ or K+/H+ antiporter